MDISTVISKTKELLLLAESYKMKSEQKTAIDSQDTGLLAVNSIELNVSGAAFDTFLATEVSNFTTELATIKTSMQTKTTEIDTEID